jgi:hypothetical protein
MTLLEAMGLLTGIRILLPAFGLKNVRKILRTFSGGLQHTSDGDVTEILRLLEAAARRCPLGSTCLTRALAAQLLLRRSGIASRLCIGVKRDHQRKFEAHAWLERDGEIILGGSDDEIRQWVPLRGIDERTA